MASDQELPPIEEIVNRIEELDDSVIELEEEFESRLQDVADIVESSLEEFHSSLDELIEKQKGLLKSAIEKLRLEIGPIRSACDFLVSSTKTITSSSTVPIAELLKRAAQLDEEEASFRKEVAEFEERMAKFKEEQELLELDRDDLELERAELQATIDQKHAELENTIRNEKRQVEVLKTELQGQLDELKHEWDELTAEGLKLQERSRELDELETELDADREELELKLRDLDAKSHALHAEPDGPSGYHDHQTGLSKLESRGRNELIRALDTFVKSPLPSRKKENSLESTESHFRISFLMLRLQVKQKLVSAQIRTYGDLTSLTRDELRQRARLSQDEIEHLDEKMESAGLRFAQSHDLISPSSEILNAAQTLLGLLRYPSGDMVRNSEKLRDLAYETNVDARQSCDCKTGNGSIDPRDSPPVDSVPDGPNNPDSHDPTSFILPNDVGVKDDGHDDSDGSSASLIRRSDLID